jgi:hypothetical protein
VSAGESAYEWRRERGVVNRTAESVTDLPIKLVARRGMVTDSAKRKLYLEGTVGKATILKAPSGRSAAGAGETFGRFVARVEVPGSEPYEAKIWQSYAGFEWDLLQPDAVVECRVDPDNHRRVLLVAPEPDDAGMRMEDSRSLLASGERAVATVRESSPLGSNAPGTEDPFFLLVLELQSEDEAQAWTVRFGQRVPKGAEDLVAPGSKLQVAYSAVNDDEAVAVDWPATSGRRFS